MMIQKMDLQMLPALHPTPPPIFNGDSRSPLGSQFLGSDTLAGNELTPQGDEVSSQGDEVSSQGKSPANRSTGSNKFPSRRRLLSQSGKSGSSGSPSLAGSGLSGASSDSLSSGLGGSTDAFEGGNGEYGESSDSKRADGRRRYSPSDLTGSFAGGRNQAGFSGGDRGYDSLGSRRSRSRLASLNKNKMDKKGNLKRSAFSKDGSHDTIFKKMSRFIQTYCSKKGKGECY